MAAERAAPSGSRVAGMVCGLWVLVLVSSVLALEEVLLDTTGETSEIGWLTYPPGGWDEVSVLDDQRRLTRTFEACHVARALPGPGQDNWLQTHFVERRGAQRAHIRLHFSVRACSSLGVPAPGGPTKPRLGMPPAHRALPAASPLTLRPPRVLVGGLRAHVPYILEVQAVNGVSELSPDPPQAAAVNVSTSHAVPAVHQVSRASSSITVSWPQPDQANGDILDYQLRYYDQAEDESHSFTLTSETNMATVTQLSPGHIYGFQVRARTAAGHGPYGGKVYFQTLPQGELSAQLPERLSLVVGSILGALAFLLLAAITVLALVFQSGVELATWSSCSRLGVKYYVDPSTYEDPCQAIREFAREVDPTYMKIEEVIGAGSFGEVRRGRLQPRGRREQAVAIQALWSGGAESLQTAFLGQAAVLGQFQHPNILRLEGVVTKSRPLMVVTELMELGPLDSFLRQREGQFSSLQLVAMQRGVAAAMHHLSSFAFVHRALAAHSVLVNSHLVCKVARLGHSPQGPSCMLRWAAPEVIAHGKHTTSSDVWSFGIVMWEVMSYGERPYWDMRDQEVLNAIEQEFRLPPPPGCPPGLHLLMLDTWQKDRTQRPHFDQLVAAFDKMIRKPDTLQGAEHSGGSPRDRPSQALLNPAALDFPSLHSPQAWLSAIGLECYQDSFSQSGLHTFSDVAQLSLEDLPTLGITLAGHQKKLLHHIQLLKQHLRPLGSVEV
ncbi:hypothetical protein E2I00_001682 [Balaenoptera physalus]|uniref:Receptor protein-tyrosine kinase n=1 Tax=Balaenoptera physalus TaxID=9770 RepID=A0A643BLX6_BALPH|nr:hypothetical protein E2I00_001682 [Balaenoptera physalus]